MKDQSLRVEIVKSAGMGFDEEAAKAIQQFRFEPATRDGVNVLSEFSGSDLIRGTQRSNEEIYPGSSTSTTSLALVTEPLQIHTPNRFGGIHPRIRPRSTLATKSVLWSSDKHVSKGLFQTKYFLI